MSGQPEDSQYIDKMEVSKQYTLRDLKDVILSMKQFEFAKDYVSNFYDYLLAIRTSKTQGKVKKPFLWEDFKRPRRYSNFETT